MGFSPLAGILLAIAATGSYARAPSHVTATVAIYDYARVPHSILAPAIQTAREAFHAVGVEMDWVPCPSAQCAALGARDRLEIFVMPRLRSPLQGVTAHPAGYAQADAFAHPRGYAFLDAAQFVSDRTTRPLDVVLGCIFLHEAAHLLGLHHQPHGVMRPDLEGPDIDAVAMGRAFSAEEARQLRIGLRREAIASVLR